MKHNREKSQVLRHHELWFRSAPKTNVMKAIGHFFDFRGRISCGVWWVSIVVYYVGVLLSGALFVDPLNYFAQFRFGDVSIGHLIAVLWYILIIWGILVLNIKRLHDRNLPGWWLFVGLIPILGWIYCTVQIAFLPGDEGKNRYGPAPIRLIDLWRLVVKE